MCIKNTLFIAVPVISCLLGLSAMADESGLHTNGISEQGLDRLLEQSGIYREMSGNYSQIEYGDDSYTRMVEGNLYNIEQLIGEKIDYRGTYERDRETWTSRTYHISIDRVKSKINIRNRSRSYSDQHAQEYVGRNIIAEKARKDLALLGMQDVDNTDTQLTTLMRAEKDESTGRVQKQSIAYKVRITRKLNNMRVWGQRATLSYFLDGSLHKAALIWPDIRSKSYQLSKNYTKRELLGKVYRSLQQHPLGQIQNLRAAAALVVKNGELRKVIQISGSLRGHQGRKGPTSVLEIEL